MGYRRITRSYADSARSVLAFDPDESAIASVRNHTPPALRGKPSIHVADVANVRLPEGANDVSIFSMSM